jgi:hypothetical protein
VLAAFELLARSAAVSSAARSVIGTACSVTVGSMMAFILRLSTTIFWVLESDLWEAIGRPIDDARLKKSARREAGLGELSFDQPEAGPHHIDLFAAIGIRLAPIGATEAVIVGHAFQQLGESAGLVAG